MYRQGGSRAEMWRLKSVPPVAFNQERPNLTEGGLDVQGGYLPPCSQGLFRRRDERPRGGPSVRATPGHGAQDARVLRAPRVSTALELARCEYIERPHNVIALGNSGTGKTHIALGLGLAACQRGLSVGFTTAAALVHELIEARDERRLLNLQRRLARLKLLIIDELGFVPLSKTGAELLFEVFSQRYERGSVLVTSK